MSNKEGQKLKEQPQERKKKNFQKLHWRTPAEPKKKDPEAIPILKYGPSNNFTLFKEALANAAMKEYGDLEKLIKQGKYYEPKEPNIDYYDLDFDPHGMNKATYLEDVKEYRRQVNKMKSDRSKLYALILQYLSEESLDEVKRQENFEEVDKATDPKGLWKMVEETHKVTTVSKVEAVTKLSARNTYKLMRQGNYESIIVAYKERFNAALKAYQDQKNPEMADTDIAMDFFNGLDNARYASFKAETINILTSSAIEQPANLNAMYLLANQWLNTAKSHPSGLAATFATTLDLQEPQKGNKKKNRGGKKKKQENKEKKDTSEVECFSCGIKGHYANACPHKIEKNKKPQDSASEEEDDERVHVTWGDKEYCAYSTYQVNAVSDAHFTRTEVVLDNAADVSVVHPSLLRNVVPVDKAIRINGVGGHQFMVDQSGYLDPLFSVYTSKETKTNILSFAQVEDEYPITYVPQESFTVHLPKGDLVFKRKNGMYVADWTAYRNIFSTTTMVCTKAEEERAHKAYELACISGFPSMNELVHLVDDGNVIGMPALTRDDVLRAYNLYGTPPLLPMFRKAHEEAY